jgi:hypothetical protein
MQRDRVGIAAATHAASRTASRYFSLRIVKNGEVTFKARVVRGMIAAGNGASP